MCFPGCLFGGIELVTFQANTDVRKYFSLLKTPLFSVVHPATGGTAELGLVYKIYASLI